MTQGAIVDLADKFAGFSDHWRPRVAAQLNGQDVRLVKVQGIFPWHSHADADELVLVWKGRFRVEFRDRVETLDPGQFIVVPRGDPRAPVVGEGGELFGQIEDGALGHGRSSSSP